ncbi:hypothetical protein PJN34_13445, partial [Mycobacterium kansasii]
MASEEPFVGSEAVRSGTLRPHQLRSRFRAVYPDVYVRRDQQLTGKSPGVVGFREPGVYAAGPAGRVCR